ncbi:MAG: hypothetical protein AAF560_10155 [Acidobacteriota bacterium]
MASDIVRNAQDIATLIKDLAESPDSAHLENLRVAAKVLEAQAGLVLKEVKNWENKNEDERGEVLQSLHALLQPASLVGGATFNTEKTRRPDSEEMRINTFFEQVSEAVVKAQSHLNSVSLDYVNNLDPRIAPAYFSIPTLKAELKVGFQHRKETGLNLILFSNAEDKQAYGESTVAFDLVAAPPPPGLAPEGELAVPTPRFLVLGEDRSRLLEATRQLAEDRGKNLRGAMYENTLRSGLAQVLRFERPAEDSELLKNRYLVLWPSQQTGTKDPNKWRELLVAPLIESTTKDAKSIRFDPAAPFQSQQPFLVLAANKSPASDEAKMTADLGASLNTIALAIKDWSLAMRLSTALPPIPAADP